MWLPLLGLILGVVLGILTDIQIPSVYENYLSIAVSSGSRYNGRRYPCVIATSLR